MGQTSRCRVYASFVIYWTLVLADNAQVNRKNAKQTGEQYEHLRTILHNMEQPIMQISDRLAAIQDKLDS